MKCRKVGFNTRAEAMQRLSQIQAKAWRGRRSVKARKPTRAYHCHKCKLWHLTKMSKAEYNGGSPLPSYHPDWSKFFDNKKQ